MHLRIRQGAAVLSGTPSAEIGHRIGSSEAERGLFGQWHWDGTTLRASVDPLGYFSLFVYAKGGEVALSPSILQILALGADPEVDSVAMAVFHRIGHFLEEDTPFRHIKVLPPGGRLVWRDGVATITGGIEVPQEQSLTRAQAVEAFIDLPRAAIRQFLAAWDGPVVLPLSGGRDSRHILLEMVHQGRKPDTCATFHYGGRHLDSEVQSARALATRAGVHHTLLGRPRMRLRDGLRAMLMTQLCADEHAQMMPMRDYLAGSPAAALDGIGGDILTNPDDNAAEFLTLARKGDFAGIAEKLVAGHGSVISRFGHPGGAGAIHSPDLHAAAIERIAASIRKFEAAPDPYQAYWFWNRTRREIAFVSTGVLGGAAMVACPFLDPEFVKLGLSLPWSVTGDQKLHDDAIFKAYPAYADVPFTAGFKSQRMPRLRKERLTNVLDGLRVATMARPGLKAFPALQAAITRSPLRRGPADIYRLHHEFVSGMNAKEAQRLIALGDRLDQAAPKGQEVVTDVFSGT